jgi:hypothetical protein
MESANEIVDPSSHRQYVLELIHKILSGEIDSSKTPLDALFNQSGPRQTYVSPKNRGGYDYGYTRNYTGEIPFTGDK